MISSHQRLIGITAKKDLDSKIIECNQGFIAYSGHDNTDLIIGKTDNNMPWSEFADLYRAHELDAIEDRSYSAIIPVKDYKDNNLLFLHTKIKKFDKEYNQDIILCHAVEIINPDLNQLFQLLMYQGEFSEFNKQFYLGKGRGDIKLSKRQQEVLFFLIRGKSAKMIAKVLNISSRTVEYYTEILKNKFNCLNKGELIEKAINCGYSQNIPTNENIKDLLTMLNNI